MNVDVSNQHMGDALGLLAVQQICDSQVVGLSSGWAYWPWTSYLHLCASVTKQYNLVPAKEVISLAGKVALPPPIPLSLYTLSYWSNPLIVIIDIQALWRSGLSARAPECQKLQLVG